MTRAASTKVMRAILCPGLVLPPEPNSASEMDHFGGTLTMRRSRASFLPPVAARRPRRGDLQRAVKPAVLDGVIPAGAQLPSTRQAAAEYGVSRGLMEEVYAQLSEEGFLERAVGRGTFVSDAVPHPASRGSMSPSPPPALSLRGRVLAANAACREPDVLRQIGRAAWRERV